MSDVTLEDIRQAAKAVGVSGRALGVHSSLRSFGWVEGGAQTVIDGLLLEGCTIVVPTFTDFVRPAPNGRGPARNGFDYESSIECVAGNQDCVYSTDTNEVSKSMGVIPKKILQMASRDRGEHPLCSFAGVGPRSSQLIGGQKPFDVFAPLEAVAAADGFYVLMGVGLNRMTAIHLAERNAGRNLFRRWANGPAGTEIETQVGGCSSGFESLAPAVAPLEAKTGVGRSQWRIYPARTFLEAAASAIRSDPACTHCGSTDCLRCNDAVQGGPILNG